MRCVVLIVSLLLVGFCLSVMVAGLYLSWPAAATVGPAPVTLPGAEDVEIASASGSQLRGWFVPSDRPGGGAVVLMHGVRGNRLSLVERARVLKQNGFSVLLFDFQAHSESTGRHITFGRLEAMDAAAAVAFVHERLPTEKVGAIGFSLGGAAALLGAKPLDVDVLVLESVYPDIDAALTNRLKIALGPVPGALLTPLLSTTFKLLLPPLIGVRPGELRPIDHISEATAALLVVSGTADRHTPIAEAKALFDHAREPKTFWPVAGAGHIDLEQYDPQAYWLVVMPFLIRYLRHP